MDNTPNASGEPDDDPVELNRQDGRPDSLRARISPWGLYLTHLWPDGQRDVVLGHADPDARRADRQHLGCVVGRHANRIRNSAFALDGWRHELGRNAGDHHLHGGHGGFGQQPWRLTEQAADRARFVLLSPHGQEGYPGNLQVTATLSLPAAQVLRLQLDAVTDAPTPVNLTWHPYFNLDGHKSGTAGSQRILIEADHYLPMAEDFCPTGEILAVDGTPFDLRGRDESGAEPAVDPATRVAADDLSERPTDADASGESGETATPLPRNAGRIEDQLSSHHPQLRLAGGFDHCFVVSGTGLRRAARLESADGQLAMEVWSTQPGIQFYTGNSLALDHGKDGARYQARSGVCLESQGFPDAPNHAHFPSTILRPGEVYHQVIEYRFEVR